MMQTNMPSFFFRAMQQPGSESALFCLYPTSIDSSTSALLAGRGMAQMSCNYAHKFDAP
jgi:hypothetical protein